MGEYVLYKALHSYTPRANDENALHFLKDDVLEEMPEYLSNTTYPRNGLYAYNRRTRKHGFVPSKMSFLGR